MYKAIEAIQAIKMPHKACSCKFLYYILWNKKFLIVDPFLTNTIQNVILYVSTFQRK